VCEKDSPAFCSPFLARIHECDRLLGLKLCGARATVLRSDMFTGMHTANQTGCQNNLLFTSMAGQ